LVDAVRDRALAGLAVDETDGIRVTGRDGWWLLRGSNTEAKLSARVEGRDAAALARMLADLRAFGRGGRDGPVEGLIRMVPLPSRRGLLAVAGTCVAIRSRCWPGKGGRDALLVADTGAGKTLAGFLPTLVDAVEGRMGEGHTRSMFRRSRLWRMMCGAA
jgi:hypothetical protein